MNEYYLEVPLKNDDIIKLHIGDMVYFSGEAWTCRSRVQKAVFDEGRKLPFSTKERNLLIHAGPVVINQKGEWKITSFGPTTSIRFERWGARSVREWGLKAIVGKGTMGKTTQLGMQENICIHACPIGLTTNLYLDKITVKDVFWQEFGSIESIWVVHLQEYGPFLIDIDCKGNSYFDEMDKVIECNKKIAYEYLNIPDNFRYTELY